MTDYIYIKLCLYLNSMSVVPGFLVPCSVPRSVPRFPVPCFTDSHRILCLVCNYDPIYIKLYLYLNSMSIDFKSHLHLAENVRNIATLL